MKEWELPGPCPLLVVHPTDPYISVLPLI